MHEKSTRINEEESRSCTTEEWNYSARLVLQVLKAGVNCHKLNILQFSIIHKLVTQLTEILRKKSNLNCTKHKKTTVKDRVG